MSKIIKELLAKLETKQEWNSDEVKEMLAALNEEAKQEIIEIKTKKNRELEEKIREFEEKLKEKEQETTGTKTEYERLQEQIKALQKTMEEERRKREEAEKQVKYKSLRETVLNKLAQKNFIKPEYHADWILGKVQEIEGEYLINGKTLDMFIEDFAKENPEFIKANTKAGSGMAGTNATARKDGLLTAEELENITPEFYKKNRELVLKSLAALKEQKK